MAKKITIKLSAEDIKAKIKLRDGIDGKDGAQGKEGERGPEGKQGKVGTTGEKGDKGDDGLMGIDGIPGKDGSPDTRLQILEKINSGVETDIKISSAQVEGLKDLDFKFGVLDQRTQFLLNKKTSSGDPSPSYWSRTGTTLSPTNVGDDLANIGQITLQNGSYIKNSYPDYINWIDLNSGNATNPQIEFTLSDGNALRIAGEADGGPVNDFYVQSIMTGLSIAILIISLSRSSALLLSASLLVEIFLK